MGSRPCGGGEGRSVPYELASLDSGRVLGNRMWNLVPNVGSFSLEICVVSEPDFERVHGLLEVERTPW